MEGRRSKEEELKEIQAFNDRVVANTARLDEEQKLDVIVEAGVTATNELMIDTARSDRALI